MNDVETRVREVRQRQSGHVVEREQASSTELAERIARAVPNDGPVEPVNGLSERGIGLAAGDLLSTGSLTVPTPLRRGQTYVARFGDLQTLSVTVGQPARAPAREATS